MSARWKFVIAATAGCAAIVAGTTTAGAATGDLLYQGCITGNQSVGPTPTGNGACASNGNLKAAGAGSGLDRLFAVAVSSDGTSLYALSLDDDAIARFSRDPATGALTYLGCITGRTENGSVGVGGNGSCDEIPSHTSNGFNSGLDGPYGIVISGDGTSVYVAAQDDDSIVHFQRNTTSGALSYQGCTTGETQTGPTVGGGNNACVSIYPTRTSNGTDSGIDKVRALAMDSNGESLYALAPQDDSIVRFTRAAGTGLLTHQLCLTAEEASGPPAGGNNSCGALPGISAFGSNSGFDNPQAAVVSPNGASVYVASGNDGSVTRFDRTAVTGLITHQGCLSRDSLTSATCTLLAGATANAIDTGFDNIRSVAVSPDGSSLYTTAGADSAIAHFTRTPAGVIGFVSCLTKETQTGASACTQLPGATSGGINSGWSIVSSPPSLAVKPDGTGVFFGTAEDDSVVQLDRAGSGALTFRRCLTSETESAGGCASIAPAASNGTNTALDSTHGLAMSSDGSSLYSISSLSDAVSRFSVEPAPPSVSVPNTPVTPVPALVSPKKCKKAKKKKGKKGAEAAAKCKKKKKKGKK